LGSKRAGDILLLADQAETQNRWGAVHNGFHQHLGDPGCADGQPSPSGAFDEDGGLGTRVGVVRADIPCSHNDSARVVTEPDPRPQCGADLFDQLAQ
jgi:hypothetical protein